MAKRQTQAETPSSLRAQVASLKKERDRLKTQVSQLETTQSLFRTIVETADDFIFCKDTERRYTFVNRAMAQLFGMPAEKLIGLTPEELFDAESAQVVAEVDKIALSGQVADAVRTLQFGGKQRTFHTVQTPVRDRLGHITGVCGIVREVTSEVEARDALRTSRAQLLTTIDSLPFDFFAIDRHGRYFLLNDSTRRQWGEILGTRPEDVAPNPEVRNLWRSNNARAMRGETVREEVWFRVKGEDRCIYNVISPIRDGDAIEGILGINIDITARKLAERELAEYKDQLEDLVRKRTDDLEETTRELRHQIEERQRVEGILLDVAAKERKRLGENLHDSLGQVLSGINFLMRPLTKSLESKRLAEAEDAARISELVREAIAHARTIARDISPVERMDQGLAMALRELAQETSRTYRVECDVKADDECISAEDKITIELYHIAREAVSNAVRHARARRLRISLSCGPEKGLLSITDDGKGMSGTREDNEGMGMHIMRHRARRVGATLSVSSTSRGTTVVCEFPGKT